MIIPGADGKLFGPVIAKTWLVPIYEKLNNNEDGCTKIIQILKSMGSL